MALGESADSLNLLEYERLHRVMSTVPVGFFEADAHGSLTWASPQFCELAGTTQVEAFASGWMESIDAQDRAYVERAWNDAIAAVRATEIHFRFVRPRGTVYARLMLVPDPARTPLRFFAAVTNITEFVDSAARLARSGAQFREIAQAMPQLAWIASADGTIEYFNKPWLNYTGITVADARGRNSKGIVHPDDLPMMWERWNSALATGEPYEFEYRLRRKSDGSYRWFIARASPVRSADGHVERWIGTATDIDAQKRAIANLRFVIDASTQFLPASSVDAICRSMADLAIERVADSCRVVLLDERGQCLETAAASRNSACKRQGDRSYHNLIGGFVEECVRTNTPLLVPHLEQGAGRTGVLCALIVPLSTESGTVYGAVSTLSSASGRSFSDEDLEVLEMVARRAAAAIHTVRAFDEEHRRVQRLQLISRASELIFESHDLQATFDNVTAFIAAELADLAYVMQIEDGSSLRTVSCAHRDPRKNNITAHLRGQRTLRPEAEERTIRMLEHHHTSFQSGMAQEHLLPNIWDYLAPDVRALKVHSAITVPLYSRGETLGALVAYWCDSPRDFTDADLPIFNDLGRRLSIAIEHVNALQRERKIAEALQQALLPSVDLLPEHADLCFSAEYRPSSSEAEVGGDWYDAVTLRDGTIMVSVGDVTGRGLEAAGLMGKVRQAVNMAAMYESDPARILDDIDFQLRTRRSPAIVTAFVGFIDSERKAIRYANAGHPPPLLRRDGDLIELRSGGLPLGLRDHADAEKTSTQSLEGAQLLALYTDGLIEGTRDLAFGERRLRQAVCSQAALYVRNTARFICDTCLPFEIQDDTAVLAVLFGERIQWSFDAENAQAAHDARDRFMAALRCAAAPHSDFNAAELIFGELIGNVVRHAPGPIDVQLEWPGVHPVLHVTDRGKGFVRDAALPRNPLSESGRGLYIISKMARTVRIERIPGYGNHIAVELALKKS